MISNRFLYNILEIQEKHPNLYIGGSISLILQNVISRKPGDIDWVSPNKTHILDIFNNC
jgi:hypothetical protein